MSDRAAGGPGGCSWSAASKGAVLRVELATYVLEDMRFKDGIKVTDDETTTTDEKVAT